MLSKSAILFLASTSSCCPLFAVLDCCSFHNRSGFVNKEQEKSILLLSGFITAVVLNKAHNLIRKGFPAGFAEMDMNVKGRAADVLHKVGFGGQRGKRLRGVLVLLVSLFIGSPFKDKAPCGRHMRRSYRVRVQGCNNAKVSTDCILTLHSWFRSCGSTIDFPGV